MMKPTGNCSFTGKHQSPSHHENARLQYINGHFRNLNWRCLPYTILQGLFFRPIVWGISPGNMAWNMVYQHVPWYQPINLYIQPGSRSTWSKVPRSHTSRCSGKFAAHPSRCCASAGCRKEPCSPSERYTCHWVPRNSKDL